VLGKRRTAARLESVQANPGDESPLLSRQEFSDSIVTDDLTWYLCHGATVPRCDKTASHPTWASLCTVATSS
jgi:hypothetical protein